jgi:hypothetical protein
LSSFQDEVPLKPAYKAAVFQYLRAAIPHRLHDKAEVERRLLLVRFQDDLFDLIIECLERKDMHVFLKLFRTGLDVKKGELQELNLLREKLWFTRGCPKCIFPPSF